MTLFSTLTTKAARRAVSVVLDLLPAGAVAIRHLDGTTDTHGKGEPYFTIVIKSDTAYARLLGHPSMSFAEAYVDGDIDIEGDIEMVSKYAFDMRNAVPASDALRRIRSPWENVKRKQQQQIGHHYDIGNEFFRLWLDTSMMYSCAYFESDADTLEEAQRNKRALVHRKLMLQPGQRVLEIGSGWGTALVEAAQNFGISGVGVTLSTEQLQHAQQLARASGVDKLVEFRLQNYQDIVGEEFDAVYSIGMYEHVGKNNANAYFTKVDTLLKPGGISLLHTVTKQSEEPGQPWINKYIFPGAYVPSSAEVVQNILDHRLRFVHAENLRLHYARTLEEWFRRFDAHRDETVTMFDERFVRMWTFYLLSCAGAFRYGAQDLVQFMFTKGINNDLPLTNRYMYGADVNSARSAA